MPNELKPSRSYHEALRRLGVQNPGEVSVGVPLQLVAIAEQLAHLQPPIPVNVAGAGASQAAGGAGVYSIAPAWHILSPGGAWVVQAGVAGSTDGILGTSITDPILAGAAAITPGLLAPRNAAAVGVVPLLSTAAQGTTNVPVGGGYWLSAGANFGVPFWVESGIWVYLLGSTANAAIQGSIAIQEVP